MSHKLGIAQKDLNKLQNKLFGIECNFEELNGLDFKKGCYVGQENTARIKLKNKLTKRLLPIEIIKGKLQTEDEIFQKDQLIGKILIDSEYPFGLIKFNDEFNFLEECESRSAKIMFFKPVWMN